MSFFKLSRNIFWVFVSRLELNDGMKWTNFMKVAPTEWVSLKKHWKFKMVLNSSDNINVETWHEFLWRTFWFSLVSFINLKTYLKSWHDQVCKDTQWTHENEHIALRFSFFLFSFPFSACSSLSRSKIACCLKLFNQRLLKFVILNDQFNWNWMKCSLTLFWYWISY